MFLFLQLRAEKERYREQKEIIERERDEALRIVSIL